MYRTALVIIAIPLVLPGIGNAQNDQGDDSMEDHLSVLEEDVKVLTEEQVSLFTATQDAIQFKVSLNRNYPRSIRARQHDGQKILVVGQPGDALVRASVHRMLFNAPPGREFSTFGSPAPFRMTIRQSDRAVMHLVSRLPNAIGYARITAVDERVKILTVDGLGPRDAGYFLIIHGDGSSE